MVVVSFGFLGSPVWLLGASASFLVAFLKKEGLPAPADFALFAALTALITVYGYLAFLD